MQNAGTAATTIPQAHRTLRGVIATLALVAFGSFGFAATPVAQTALVTNSQGLGSNSAAAQYRPGSNPRKISCQSREEALNLSNSLAREAGAKVLITSGTKSMEPLIHGKAYVVVLPLSYNQITKGELLVYMGRPNAAKQDRTCMLHRAVQQDRAGWLMSGDNNRWTESWDRVTPTTYMGTVTTIVEFPQA